MKVSSAGFVVLPGSGIFSHSHENEHELHFFVKANGTYWNDSHTCRINDGSLVYARPRTDHGAAMDAGGDEMRFYFVRFIPDEETEKLLHSIGERLPIKKPLRLGQQYTRIFEDIRRRSNSPNPQAQMAANLLLKAHLFDLAVEEGSEQLRASHPAVDRCVALMQERIHGTLSVGECMKVSGVGKAYLTRLFQQQTGMPPMKYYTALKMESARYQLSRTRDPVYMVAQKLGYWDEFHFSKTFKRFYGMAPRVFRESS